MERKGKRKDIWSPYGHESARRSLLAQRRAQIILAAVAIALLYAFFLNLTLDEENDTQSGSTTVERQQEQEPVTVTVRPGQMAEYVNGQTRQPDGRAPPRPVYEEQQNQIVQTIQPFLALVAPLAAAFWLLSRVGTSARGRLAELNFGVYKGAMPYEMHTARAQKNVFTYREVGGHVFGKTREDFLFGSYLHAPPLAVRRMLGEPIEGAEVRALKRGGRPRVTVSPTPRHEPNGSWWQQAAAEARRHVAPLVERLPRRDPKAARLRDLRRRRLDRS